MGMYTELVIKCEVKQDLPKNVESVLQYLFNDAECPTELPFHNFFDCQRWHMIGRGCSYYHLPFALSKYEDGYIFSRSDFKDYDNEIDKFIEWISPYLDHFNGDVIGWNWYEEYEEPTLIKFNGN